MVVGAPDVDQPVEAALELVEVVGDVRGEVRVLAGRALEDAVLVVAVLGRAQPQRALGAVRLAARARARRTRGATARRLAARAACARENQTSKSTPIACIDARICASSSCDAALGDDLARSSVAGAGDLLGELAHVVALVAALGHLLAARAGLDRRAEPLRSGCRCR